MSRSPLKDRPLRNPGQSGDDELDNIIRDTLVPYALAGSMTFIMAFMEWTRWFTGARPNPWLYTLLFALVFAIGFVKIRGAFKRAKNIKLGRDGERAVGQYLELLRENGAKVFHDVRGPSFNIDHVVLHASGVYVIETKTYSKPDSGQPVIQFDGEGVQIMGRTPDRNPVSQSQALARWLGELLADSTGKAFHPRPVVVFPGWFIEPTAEAKKSDVWVLNPKALPAFIANSRAQLSAESVQLAAFHLSRYVRALERQKK